MFPADPVLFPEDIFNERLHFWYSMRNACLTHTFSFISMLSGTEKHGNNGINWCEMGLVQNRTSLI